MTQLIVSYFDISYSNFTKCLKYPGILKVILVEILQIKKPFLRKKAKCMWFLHISLAVKDRPFQIVLGTFLAQFGFGSTILIREHFFGQRASSDNFFGKQADF